MSEMILLRMNFTEETVSEVISSVAQRLRYNELKPCQHVAVKEFVSKRDLFLSLPTGYGKLFCYTCLPWTFDLLKGKHNVLYLFV